MSPPTPRAVHAIDLAHLVDQVVDYAIIALDPSGTIQTWNQGAERLKGYAAADAIGRHFSVFYTEEDRRSGLPLRLLAEAHAQGRVSHTGWRVRRDGTRFWGDVTITAVHDGDVHLGFGKVTRDLTEAHELVESLRRSEERLRLLVEQVVDHAIIALDPSGTIESWNVGAERLKGYPAADAIGRHFSIFYTEEDRQSGLPLQLLVEAHALGRVSHTGWRVRRDGTRFWGDVTITAIHDAKGGHVGFAKVTRDRTEAHELALAREALLVSLAHDFRSPILAISGYAEMLEEAGDRTEDFVMRIQRNADRLVDMTDQLLEQAQLERVRPESTGPARSPQPPAAVDVPALARRTVQELDSILDVSRVEVHGDGAAVQVDAGALERILTNLVANAVRYSVDGPVEIATRVDGDGVRITVRDRGRGIAAEDLPTIFDGFVRGRLAGPDGGIGLGLTSVRQLVAGLGGAVSIDSVVGQGTTVTVDLPAG